MGNRITHRESENLLTDFKKSRILETKNLSTDADSRTDTIFERSRDLISFLFLRERGCMIFLKTKKTPLQPRGGRVDQ